MNILLFLKIQIKCRWFVEDFLRKVCESSFRVVFFSEKLLIYRKPEVGRFWWEYFFCDLLDLCQNRLLSYQSFRALSDYQCSFRFNWLIDNRLSSFLIFDKLVGKSFVSLCYSFECYRSSLLLLFLNAWERAILIHSSSCRSVYNLDVFWFVLKRLHLCQLVLSKLVSKYSQLLLSFQVHRHLP